MMRVCLIGATGLIGEQVLAMLLKHQEVSSIIVLGRRAPEVQNTKMQYLKTELAQLGSLPAIQAEHWICCLGTTIKVAGSPEAFRAVDLDAVVDFAKLAKRSQAQSLHVVSALGADFNSAVFYNRIKGEMQNLVAEVKIPATYFYQPSLLLGNRKEFRLGEKIAIFLTPIFTPVLLGSLRRYAPIAAQRVALYIVRNLSSTGAGVFYIENAQML